MGISYIVPAFNCAATIGAAINSIYNGNLSGADEIVVVNDASTDRTLEIVYRLARAIKCLTVINHPRNLGGGIARNTAAEAAKNELIFCLDSDNLLVPGSVPALARFLREHRADAAAFGSQRFFQRHPKVITHHWAYKRGQITLADLLCGHINPASSGNYLFSRRSWELSGKYPSDAGALDTWGFGLRQIACGAKFVTMPGSYYLHRWGYDSYWVRWSRQCNAKERSKTAARLIAPYAEMLTDRSRQAMISDDTWFDDLKQKPLSLKSGVGINGESFRTFSYRLRGFADRAIRRITG